MKWGVEKKKIGTEIGNNSTEKQREVTVKKREGVEQNRDNWGGEGG